jgi:hypothetical protein
MFFGVVVADLQRLQIRIAQGLLAGEALIQQRFDGAMSISSVATSAPA